MSILLLNCLHLKLAFILHVVVRGHWHILSNLFVACELRSSCKALDAFHLLMFLQPPSHEMPVFHHDLSYTLYSLVIMNKLVIWLVISGMELLFGVTSCAISTTRSNGLISPEQVTGSLLLSNTFLASQCSLYLSPRPVHL